MRTTSIVKLIIAIGLLLSGGLAHPARSARANDESTLTIHALDCRHGDTSTLSGCTPLAGVPFGWKVILGGSSIDVRFTVADGSDTISVTGYRRYDLGYLRNIAWTGEPIFPLIPRYVVDVHEGQSIDFTFVFVERAKLDRFTPRLLTIRTFDCTNRPTAPPSRCAPLPYAPILSFHESGFADFRNMVTDERGEITINLDRPTYWWLDVYATDKCPLPVRDTLRPITPRVEFLVDGSADVIVDIAYVDASVEVATPEPAISEPMPVDPPAYECPYDSFYKT